MKKTRKQRSMLAYLIEDVKELLFPKNISFTSWLEMALLLFASAKATMVPIRELIVSDRLAR